MWVHLGQQRPAHPPAHEAHSEQALSGVPGKWPHCGAQGVTHADSCAPAGLCSYFLSTEDLPRRRQLYR